MIIYDVGIMVFYTTQKGIVYQCQGNAETAAKVERSGNDVTVSRWMMDIPPSPTCKQFGVFEGNVDRCQILTWTAPSTVSIDDSGAPAGTGGDNSVRGNGIEMYNLSTVTPETRNTSHYFWSQALGPGLNDKLELNDFFYDQILNTSLEDKEVLEAQQQFIDTHGKPSEIDINADAGALQARQTLAPLIEAEAQLSIPRKNPVSLTQVS